MLPSEDYKMEENQLIKVLKSHFQIYFNSEQQEVIEELICDMFFYKKNQTTNSEMDPSLQDFVR